MKILRNNTTLPVGNPWMPSSFRRNGTCREHCFELLLTTKGCFRAREICFRQYVGAAAIDWLKRKDELDCRGNKAFPAIFLHMAIRETKGSVPYKGWMFWQRIAWTLASMSQSYGSQRTTITELSSTHGIVVHRGKGSDPAIGFLTSSKGSGTMTSCGGTSCSQIPARPTRRP